jgi:hypothetical protein
MTANPLASVNDFTFVFMVMIPSTSFLMSPRQGRVGTTPDTI